MLGEYCRETRVGQLLGTQLPAGKWRADSHRRPPPQIHIQIHLITDPKIFYKLLGWRTTCSPNTLGG